MRSTHHLEVHPPQSDRFQTWRDVSTPAAVFPDRLVDLLGGKQPRAGPRLDVHTAPPFDLSSEAVGDRSIPDRVGTLWRIDIATMDTLPNLHMASLDVFPLQSEDFTRPHSSHQREANDQPL